jgi:hypothetical protein
MTLATSTLAQLECTNFWRKSGSHCTFRITELLPRIKRAILELFLFGCGAHPSRRIWQFPPAVETANIIEAATIAVGPRGATVNAIKHGRENPFDPGPIRCQGLVRLRGASARVVFRVRALRARRIKSVIFLRARAVRAFTVPRGTPRIWAVSRIDNPSIWRS